MCFFSERELSDFHNFLERSFPFNDSSRVKKGVCCVGRQPQTNIWALNENVQIDEDGTQSDSPFVWTPIGGPCIELMYGKSGTTSIDIRSHILTPLESSTPLHELLTWMQVTLKHNFVAGIK